jgi:murein DD-endopeptidase MepM/ murein hydrolase activator NlpD
VRGYFGDPRTQFRGPPTQGGIMSSRGAFSFHSGIDIVAAAGEAAYPVVSGTVRRVSGDEVAVDAPDGRTFAYWHIRPTVSTGEAAIAGKTVLGRVLPRAGHLHFGEYVDGAFVNPLVRGHLRPFADRTNPRIRGVEIRQAGTGAIVAPLTVRGRVKIAVDAFDVTRGVTGPWAGLPVTPVLVKWRLQTWKGQIAIPDTIAADFRGTLPPRAQFWQVYARGTYQNNAVFGTRLATLQPGRFLFNLVPGGLDTRHLRWGDNVYDLFVTAVDIRGNASTLKERITVRNVRART